MTITSWNLWEHLWEKLSKSSVCDGFTRDLKDPSGESILWIKKETNLLTTKENFLVILDQNVMPLFHGRKRMVP